jgi:hypothetical protein
MATGRVYQAEYVKLRRLFLLVVNTFVKDERYISKFIKMLEDFDENIERKRVLKYENITYKMKANEKIRFEKYCEKNNILDFN